MKKSVLLMCAAMSVIALMAGCTTYKVTPPSNTTTTTTVPVVPAYGASQTTTSYN